MKVILTKAKEERPWVAVLLYDHVKQDVVHDYIYVARNREGKYEVQKELAVGSFIAYGYWGHYVDNVEAVPPETYAICISKDGTPVEVPYLSAISAVKADGETWAASYKLMVAEEEARTRRSSRVKPLKCQRCGNEWKPRIKNPKQCPRCKQYTWAVERTDSPPWTLKKAQEEQPQESSSPEPEKPKT